MTAPRAMALVLWREVTERARSRSFQATTLLLAVLSLVVAAVAAQGLAGSSVHRLAVVGPMPPGLEAAVAQMAGERRRTTIEITTVADAPAGRAELRSGRLDAVAVDPSHVLVLQDSDSDEAQLLLGALRRAELSGQLVGAGVPDTEARRLTASPATRARIEVLRPFNLRGGVASLGVVATVAFLFLYGMTIAQSVVQETTSGVSNIMLATCPPGRLITGKTLGVGTVALGQGLITSLPSVALLVVRTGAPSFPAAPVAAGLLWFAIAFAIYGHLYAALGAWGRRIEKVSGTTVWVAIPMLAMATAGGYAALNSPSGGATAFLSFFPLSAPFAMPVRSAALHLPWWQAPVAAAGAIAVAVVVARLSARLYVWGLARS